MRREMEQRGQAWKAVHLLSAEEVKSLFRDVAEGLAFLAGCPFLAGAPFYEWC